MSGHPSIVRSAALLCAAHARRVLLRRNPFWADGMEQEAHHIDDDWNALQWALGCVFASYAEVLKAERFFIPFLARLYLAAISLRYALDALSGPIAALECHLYDQPHGVRYPVALLFFYRHFLFTPVAITGQLCVRWDARPLLIHAISVGAGGLYLAAGLRVVQGRASAFPLFFGALVAPLLAFAVAQFVPGAWYYNPSGYWKYSVLWHHTMVSMAWNTWWRLVFCLCIGLIVSLDDRRKAAG